MIMKMFRRTVEVKDKQGEETTNRLLSDIGTWSVKSCLVLDGEEYDLYATFDDPEKAIENVKENVRMLLHSSGAARFYSR